MPQGTQIALVEVDGSIEEHHYFDLGPRGLKFRGDKPVPVEVWRKVMRALSDWKTRGALWTADAISYGKKHYGQAEVESTLEAVSFNLMDATQAIGIGSLSEQTRELALTAQHLWVLARAELSQKEELRWGKTAVEKGLSAGDLAASIEAGKVVKASGVRGQGMTATVQGIRQAFSVLQRRWEAEEPVENKPEPFRRMLWRELDEQTRFGVRLARSLGIRVE